MSAFYLNELLLKLTVQHDPHPELYEHYHATLQALRAGESLETVLRRFEKRLLDLLGYGTDFAIEAGSGRAVLPDAYYHFHPGLGVLPAVPGSVDAVPGRVLLALTDAGRFEDEADLRQARALMRGALDHCLEGRELATRAVARSVARMERSA
jgi:DNA repair protein RecO (recombination protein O)